MFTFTYTAREASGKQQSGTVQAHTQSEAIRLLQGEGKTVTDIRVGVKAGGTERISARIASGSIRREEVISFASQLSVMLETGVPLGEALTAFVEQSRSNNLRKVVEVVADRVISGVPFSAALAEFPRAFPTLMTSLMEASEASGTMGLMLGRISDYLAVERRTIRQIRGALTYPLIMVGFAVAVTLLLVTWVLPRFARLYESREATLPALTRVVMKISNFVLTNYVELIGGAFAVFFIYTVMRMFGIGSRLIDSLKLQLPVIGPIFTNFYITRAMRTLGTLLNSGVGLLDAVRIVQKVTRNYHWTQMWIHMEQSITTGHTITEVVMRARIIPAPIAQMIAAGERSGRLPAVLEKIADTTGEDLEDSIKQGTQLIEPAMIIFVGAIIGAIAIALLLPIFNVSSIIGK